MTGVAHAKAAGGFQQRGVDQQGPTSNITNKLAFYCFLKLFTGIFAVFFADRSVSFAPTVSRKELERGAKGNQQGEIKSKGNAPCIL